MNRLYRVFKEITKPQTVKGGIKVLTTDAGQDI
jgi:hypothetical protein